MEKVINLRIVFNGEDNRIMTVTKMTGFSNQRISDILLMIGVCENLKSQYQTQLNELLRIEGGNE